MHSCWLVNSFSLSLLLIIDHQFTSCSNSKLGIKEGYEQQRMSQAGVHRNVICLRIQWNPSPSTPESPLYRNWHVVQKLLIPINYILSSESPRNRKLRYVLRRGGRFRGSSLYMHNDLPILFRFLQYWTVLYCVDLSAKQWQIKVWVYVVCLPLFRVVTAELWKFVFLLCYD